MLKTRDSCIRRNDSSKKEGIPEFAGMTAVKKKGFLNSQE
jgi:hypothetical protein